MLCVRNVATLALLLMFFAMNTASALSVSSRKLSLSMGLFADKQQGSFDNEISYVSGSTPSWTTKPRSGVYLGIGYNIYLSVFKIAEPFIGLDVQGKRYVVKSNFFDENGIIANMQEVGMAHVKIGMKFNVVNLQPYVLLGSNLAKLSYTFSNNGLQNDGQYGFGYSVGFGFEWMFATYVGVRAEYRYAYNKFRNNFSLPNSGSLLTKVKTNNVALGLVVLI